MWLLTCDGDLFDGKRIWLRPGTTHLLGRTSGRMENGERVQYLNSKSVSRKHLTIAVSAVTQGDSGKLFARSEITVTDGSKLGTILNGQKLVQETKVLDGKEYEIKLGNYEHLFHLVWHPVTLSFASGSKRVKEEALAGQRKDVLEQADVKIVSDYVTNETTHAISRKRNTTACLQALLQARWIVTDAFVEALYEALRLDNAEGLATLEQDFDKHWPKEENYLPSPGSEPTPRPDSFLKPNLDRAEVFHNYTFIFLSHSQYDNLLPVISCGGGKALVREVEVGKTTVDEVVSYMKEVAGRKNDRQFRLSQQSGSGGVIVVRMVERDEQGRVLMRGIDSALGQRSVEQSEFLDPILTVDASGMRRELEEAPVEIDVSGNEGPPDITPQAQQASITPENTLASSEQATRHPHAVNEVSAKGDDLAEQPPATTPARRKNRRIITQSRFKGFDDFDPSQFSKAASESPEPSASGTNASQAISTANMHVNDASQTRKTRPNTLKREREVQDEEDMYAAILPSHAALKKRKLEAAKRGEEDPLAVARSERESATNLPIKNQRKQKELDVRAEVAKRREAEEERRRLDEEALRQAMEGVDIKELKNLATVEEMDVPVREERFSRTGGESNNPRWDPAWNGRKNFKKFRRRGEHTDAPQLRRVIVPLEEVPRRGHGIGDEYWLTPASTSVSSSAARVKQRRQTQSQSTRSGINGGRSQHDAETEQDEDETSRFRRRLQRSREEDEENARVEQIHPEEIAGRAREQAIQDAVSATPSQTLVGDSQRRSGIVASGKRPAISQGGTAPKRPKQTTLAPARSSRDEEDEDGLKFRRRR